MKRLRALLAIVAALVPGAARSAGCSPLSCAPSQFTVAGGALLAVRGSIGAPVRVLDLTTGATRWRLPQGIAAGDTLVHRDGRLVTWFDIAHGTRLRNATLEAHGAFGLVGLSQGGEWAVLQRTQTRSTTFVLLSPTTSHTVVLAGNTWSFDALRGDKLYLIEGLQERLRGAALRSRVGPAATATAEGSRRVVDHLGRPVRPDGVTERAVPVHALHRPRRRFDGAHPRPRPRDGTLRRPAR